MAYHQLSHSAKEKLKDLAVVHKISPSQVVFTPEFKESALQQYEAGYTGVEIFLAAGLPEALATYEYTRKAIKRWQETVAAGGTAALYTENRGRNKQSNRYERLSDKEKIAYLEAENAFLTALRARQQRQRSS